MLDGFMRKFTRYIGLLLILLSAVYYFLSSNLTTIHPDGKETDGLGRIVEYTFTRDITDKAVLLILFGGGIWLCFRD